MKGERSQNRPIKASPACVTKVSHEQDCAGERRRMSMFDVSSQQWRKASHACLVRVPCTDPILEVCMIDRSRQIAFSRVGRAGRNTPRKSGDNSLEGTVHGRAWRLSCVGRRWEDSAHDHDELPERRQSHDSGCRPAWLIIRTRRRALVRGHTPKLSQPHAAPRSAFRVVDGKTFGHPHRRRSECGDHDGSAARHAQLLPGRHDRVARIFRRGDPQRSLADAPRSRSSAREVTAPIGSDAEP